MNTDVFFIHNLFPLHPGTGQDVGVIDQPIARERSTGIPFLPGSTIKGVFRSEFQGGNTDDLCERVYGPDPTSGKIFAGSVQFTDARVLLFPVRSLKGVFAWVSSPFVLYRYLRDIVSTCEQPPTQIPSVEETDCFVIPSSDIVLSGEVVLEDLLLSAKEDTIIEDWADYLGKIIFQDDEDSMVIFKKRFCIVSDDVLGYILDTATEIRPHIRMDAESKTADGGALWYEETLPAETILYGLRIFSPVKATQEEVATVLKESAQKPLQFGGNATVGQGISWVRFSERGKK